VFAFFVVVYNVVTPEYQTIDSKPQIPALQNHDHVVGDPNKLRAGLVLLKVFIALLV
jgi:hypothetical protein